ncbi:MAG: hypothetical protein AABY22_03780 [Nanoarchaeota archaeon]
MQLSFSGFNSGNIQKGIKSHSRKYPCFRLWHTNPDSLSSVSENETFLTFVETDQITEYERNILSQKKTVFVTSSYTKKVMEEFGLTNIKYLQLGFDSYNFNVLNKKYYDDDRIVFGILGKYEERRKNHKKTVQAWLKKFGIPKTGVKMKYMLHCSLFNPFMIQNQGGQIIDHNPRLFQECLGGKDWGNIQFFGWFQNNLLYNDFLQSNHLVLGMGGGENFGAGEFHSVGLGRHAVILNSNGFKDWADSNNSCLVQPSGKMESHDGIFFHKGNISQQGMFFDYSEDEFIAMCEQAIKRYESNPINLDGLKLQQRTYSSTVDAILKEM